MGGDRSRRDAGKCNLRPYRYWLSCGPIGRSGPPYQDHARCLKESIPSSCSKAARGPSRSLRVRPTL
eukprot:6186329-Pleurochrysis_carterae.AAC.1